MLELSADEWTAVRLSLRIALTATGVSLPIGIFAAYALARWRFPGKTLVDGIIHLPLVLPPVVTGYMLLVMFGRRGVLVGAILCFAKALGEFGATITFVSNIPGETQTISAAIFTYTQVPGGDANAWRLTAVAVGIALAALVVSELVARKASQRLAQFE